MTALPHVVEVGERAYAYIQPEGGWFVNNTGFLVAETGVTSIDTCATPRRTLAYLDTIAEVTDAPVRTLVNTHHHGDHTYGNYLLPGATIVGHEAVRSALLAWGTPPVPEYWTEVDWGEPQIAPPFLTFEDRVRLWVEDVRCDVRFTGRPAHTMSDSIVWLPEERILFSGDLLFNEAAPLMSHGSIAGALSTLDDLAQLEPLTIVPGHGPVGGPAIIEDVRRYLRFVQDLARAGWAAGLSPLETARSADLGEFGELRDPERIVGNLHRAYAELDRLPLGARIDLGAAFSDMVAFNGGQPLSCEA